MARFFGGRSEGLPNLQDLGKLYIGEDVVECLECDLKLEMEAQAFYREAVAYCEGAKDYVIRELFEGILEGEEDHIDFLETQLELAKKVGSENYLQTQIGEGGEG